MWSSIRVHFALVMLVCVIVLPNSVFGQQSWYKYPGNPVLEVGEWSAHDSKQAHVSCVVKVGSEYWMYYYGSPFWSTNEKWIMLATSPDGVNWTKHGNGDQPLDFGISGYHEIMGICVLYDSGSSPHFRAWYAKAVSGGYSPTDIFYATSDNGIDWDVYGEVLSRGPGWEDFRVQWPCVRKDDGIYHMWYQGHRMYAAGGVGHATSTDGINWTKDLANPVIAPDMNAPWVIRWNGTYYLYVGSPSGFLCATSEDGTIWDTSGFGTPVLSHGPPGSWDDVSLERLAAFVDGGALKAWYSGYNGSIVQTGYATADGEPESWYFVHITDSHVGTAGGADRFEYVVGQINDLTPLPRFVVLSGDLVDFGGFDEDWDALESILDDLDVPYYLCAGNHDHIFPATKPEVPEPFTDVFDDYDLCPADDLHLISMNSGGWADWLEEIYWPPLPRFYVIDWVPEGSGISNPQRMWLADRIDDYPSHNKILFMHHPIVCTKRDWPFSFPGEEESNGCIINNRTEVMALCRDNETTVVLGGHIHEAYQYTVDSQDHPIPLPQNPSGGYWSSDTVSDLPMYIVTGACSQYLKYRKIEMIADEVRVWEEDAFNDLADLAEYRSDFIPLPWTRVLHSGSAGAMALDGVQASGRLHAYDSYGNHVGINPAGGIDIEISGAYYEDEPVLLNEAEPQLWTSGEVISLMLEPDESYRYELEAFEDCLLNLVGRVTKKGNRGEITVLFSKVPLSGGAVGRLLVEQGSIGYTLYVDDDRDGTVDREVPADSVVHVKLPYPPGPPIGPAWGVVNDGYSYTASTVDPESDSLYYMFDWGDGMQSAWLGPHESGEPSVGSHAWSEAGTYSVRAMAKDVLDYMSAWSDPLTVSIVNIIATIDVKPDTLNTSSKGKWVTCYIELAAGYDVDDIDISSILLNGQVPAETSPYEVGDYDIDGVVDLMVKFERASVQGLLAAGALVEIVVTGTVGEDMFGGMDYIFAIGPGHGVDDRLTSGGAEKNISFSGGYPNPFSEATEINYYLPEDMRVELALYNVAGQRVRILASGFENAGRQIVRWDGTDDLGNRLPSGIYFCRMQSDGFIKTEKVILLR